MLDKGIKVGLGTDVAGGSGVGILTAIREASLVSKTLAVELRDKPKPAASIENNGVVEVTEEQQKALAPASLFASQHLALETLFFLATLGGAQLCALEDRIGNFVVGKDFDALLIQTGQPQEQSSSSTWTPRAKRPEQYPDGLNPSLFVDEFDAPETVFEKFMFCVSYTPPGFVGPVFVLIGDGNIRVTTGTLARFSFKADASEALGL
jgi:guanine deaminase